MLSPKSRVARRVASTKWVLSAPTASLIAWRMAAPGTWASGLRVNSAVADSWLFTTALLIRSLRRVSDSSPAATIRSQPSSRSASPAAMRTA